MMGEIRTAVYGTPTVLRRDILRYAGAGVSDVGMDTLLGECEACLSGVLSYRVAYAEFPVLETDEGLDLGFAETRSRDLSRALLGCERILLFGATVGVGLDRLLSRYAALSPARALILDAMGTAHVEALCDTFCAEMAQRYAHEGCVLRPRFSPGYGDLPLALQKEVLAALDLPRKIGVTLNESLLMTPAKSVTAIVGIIKAKETV